MNWLIVFVAWVIGFFIGIAVSYWGDKERKKSEALRDKIMNEQHKRLSEAKS